MAKLPLQSTPGFNAGKSYMSKMVRISDITIDPEISSIFNVEERVLNMLIESVKTHGFYKDQPVAIWPVDGKLVLVDGRTRLTAVKEAGLEEVPAVEKEFDDREDALLYTFERQALRRNLTGAEILKAAQMLPEGRNEYGQGRKAEELAEKLGVSASTVYHAIDVARNSPEEDKKAVLDGTMSLKKAKVRNSLRRNGCELNPSKAAASAKTEGMDEIVVNLQNAHSKVGEALNYVTEGKAFDLLNETMGFLKDAENRLTGLVQ